MVACLSDNAMGSLAAKALGGPIATVHLAVDYLARVPAGQWLEVRSRLDKQGKKLLFTACEGRIGKDLAFRASAVFSSIRR
jgi:acyl-coenzyme A thioesterase PaaI-like protein